jgi:hypothetical protein
VVQQIERIEVDRRVFALRILQQREGMPPLFVDRHQLAIEHKRFRAQRGQARDCLRIIRVE